MAEARAERTHREESGEDEGVGPTGQRGKVRMRVRAKRSDRPALIERPKPKVTFGPPDCSTPSDRPCAIERLWTAEGAEREDERG